MTLIIENVKEEFLPAFRGLSKSINAKLKMSDEKKGLKKKNLNAKKNKKIPELDEAIKEYKNKECETYANFEEYKKAMNAI